MKRIPLNLGRWKKTAPSKFAMVNDADFGFVSAFNWHASKDGQFWYAKTNMKVGGQRRPVGMHRLIMGFPPGLVDHRNLNGLDNRRRNLRLSDKSKNAANSNGHRDRRSPFKGVTLDSSTGTWKAQLCGKNLGRFKTPELAAASYDAAAKLKYGQHARTNQ